MAPERRTWKGAPRPGRALGAAATGTGGSLLALVAGACCAGPVIAPLIVGVLGAGGAAWAAGLQPYSPYLLAASGLLIAYTFIALYAPASCAPEDDGAMTPPGGKARRRATPKWTLRLAKAVAWFAAFVWLAAVIANLTLS